MDKYARSLARFLEMRVQIRMGTYTTIFGTLVEVNSEFLRLEDSRIVEEYDESSWSSKMTEGDDEMIAAQSDGESIIRMQYVASVTCISDARQHNPRQASYGSSKSISETVDSAFEKSSLSLNSSSSISKSPQGEPSPTTTQFGPKPPIEPLMVEIGASLHRMADPNEERHLLDRIDHVRKDVYEELGLIMPKVRLRTSMLIERQEYRILVNESEVGRFELQPEKHLLIHSGTTSTEGFDIREPSFQLPARWIVKETPEDALVGWVVEPGAVFATHLKEIVLEHILDLLSYESVQKLMDDLGEHYPVLVSELIPTYVSVRLLYYVLKRMLKERISIRNLNLIVETIGDVSCRNLTGSEVYRIVRRRCARIICAPFVGKDQKMSVVTISDEAIANTFKNEPNVDPVAFAKLQSELQKACNPPDEPAIPILVSGVELREKLFSLLNVHLIRQTVLELNEVPSTVELRIVATIEA